MERNIEKFKALFQEIDIKYTETVLCNGNIELDICDDSMAHGCELNILFDNNGKFNMFLTN